jgi:hypothetical protein
MIIFFCAIFQIKGGFMANMSKKVLILILVMVLFPCVSETVYGQGGRAIDGRNAEKQADADSGPEDDIEDDDADFDDEPEAAEVKSAVAEPKKKVKSSDSVTKAKKEKTPPTREALLEKESKRHENEKKKIASIRKKAKDMLKQADEMDAKEMKRHDEAVVEIKKN